MEEVKMVISGAGSAAIACANLYVSFGVKPENVVMFNSKGALRKDDPRVSDMQRIYATDKHYDDLAHAMKGADVFIGLSSGDIVTPEMLLSMADNPIVFAMANPTPEINYNLAIDTRKDIIMATGRSDHPNQVNNVLGFPFIFRGALDVRATKINEEMKKEIILLYATATSQLNILKLNAEALMLANVQYSIAEKDFSNGAIDSGTLSSEKSRQSDAQEKFENSKFELSKSLMILELVTHTPILRNK